MVAIYVILVWLGLATGSFITALTWRIHKKKDWVKGRSQCEKCGHTLSFFDLIPLLSWVMLRGRCRYCGRSISWVNPVLEASGALLFAGSYLFWPSGFHTPVQVVWFVCWLIVLVGLLALVVYDFKWMLLPNVIVYPTLLVAVVGRLAYLGWIDDFKLKALGAWLISVLVSSGFFWVLYQISKGSWIGYGDVRLGLITGTLLADPIKAVAMIVLASMAGTLFALPSLVKGSRKAASKLPYGPFLILGTVIMFFFGSSLINWYQHLFLR